MVSGLLYERSFVFVSYKMKMISMKRTLIIFRGFAGSMSSIIWC